MKTRTITVGYGQTVPGKVAYSSERFEMTISSETETEEESKPSNAKRIGKKLLEEVREAVERTSGKIMRREGKDLK